MGSRITKDINDTLLSYYTRDASGNIMTVYSELKSGFEPAAIDTTAERDSLISYLYSEKDTAFVNEVIRPCLTDTQKLSTIFTMLSTGAAGTVDTILANIYSEKALGRLISSWVRDNELSLAGSDLTKDTANLEYRLNEHHLYGDSRLGLHRHDTLFSQDTVLYYYNAFNDSWKPLAYTESSSSGGGVSSYTEHTRTRGKRFYELSNHLGNVLMTITDRKLPIGDTTGGIDTVLYFVADIATANDYYPFGMLQPERSYSLGDYRFGFNGQEKETDISGVDGGHLSFRFRIYDSRLGKFLSVDPLYASYPWNSTYAFAENRVIDGIDLEGLEYRNATKGEIDNYSANGNGDLKEGDVGYVYQVGENEYVTWVGEDQYKDGDGNITTSATRIEKIFTCQMASQMEYEEFTVANEKITFDRAGYIYETWEFYGSRFGIRDINVFIGLGISGISQTFETYGTVPAWLRTAWGEYGTLENISSSVHNPRILEYHSTTQDGSTKKPCTTDEAAWCASFINWSFVESNFAGNDNQYSANAWSYKRNSNVFEIDKPAMGAIALINNSHVTFVIGVNGTTVHGYGGNQRNQTKLSTYSTSNVRYFFPNGVTPNYSVPTIRINFNTGVETTR